MPNAYHRLPILYCRPHSSHRLFLLPLIPILYSLPPTPYALSCTDVRPAGTRRSTTTWMAIKAAALATPAVLAPSPPSPSPKLS
eukprot:2404830-Rhodomonas_salina.1